jgi:hypothetical protein
MFRTIALVERIFRGAFRSKLVVAGALLSTASLLGCSSETPGASGPRDWPCEIPQGTATPPDFLTKVGCKADFELMADAPLDTSLPGARSQKVVLDLQNGNQLYFQNTGKFKIHYEFVHNSKGVRTDQVATLYPDTLDHFNPQYTQPLSQRRFLLGALTYYAEPDVWALEIAPYDTSTPAMIEQLYKAVSDQSYVGPLLVFHPTSETVEATAKKLPSSVKVKTTAQLYEGITYQPLNRGEAVGTVKIMKASDLATEYVSARDIVVLDEVPNDISATAAIVTEDFQTPLSHINVLARNRGTPNMGLIGATTNPAFVALNGKLARITVGANTWTLVPATQAESDAWWELHKPPKVTLDPLDLTQKDLRDIGAVTEHTDEPPYVTLKAIKAAILAFGAKSANYSVFDSDPLVPHKPAFGIPVYFYHQYMDQNGVFTKVDGFKTDAAFQADAKVRDTKLAEVRDMVLNGTFSTEFTTALKAKLDKDYPGQSMRFRSSTNAEDLDGFPCAGCYDSHTGDPMDTDGDQLAACLQAIRKTWATAWNLRTYEERELHGIDHEAVAMGLLVHTNFPGEEANGVAITNNIFDTSGNAPGYYVNVQYGGLFEVVHPPAGITSDSFLYMPQTQTTIYYTHSNHPAPYVGPTVLTDRQIYDLGVALGRLHTRFAAAYQPDPTKWYAIDSEFKFDDFADPGKPPTLYIKQARPYPANDSVGSAGD